MVIGIDCSRAFGSFWGGPESYSYHLIRAILKANSKHQFRLYLPPNAKENPRFNEFFSDLKIPARNASQSDAGGSNFKFQIINWPRLWTQGGLALECLVNPPDVLFILAHTLPILRRPGLKTVVTIHDLGAQYLPNYHKFPQKHYLNTMTQYAVKNATKIIAVSEYTKKDIIKKFQKSKGYRSRHHPKPFPASVMLSSSERSISNSRDSSPPQADQNDEGVVSKFEIESKIKVIYEGYEKETFYPRNQQEIDLIKKKLGIHGDYFLFVGTIQPRKNLVRLIEAFSLFQKGPSLTRTVLPELVLAGSPGWLNQEIYDAPKKFGVQDKVNFVGQVSHEDLPALISGSRAFVFPSLFEGFGLAPLEAMACGVPVILSNVTSLPEVGGEAVFYVDPNSSNDIANKMELVLSMSDSDRSVIVKKGLDQAQKFSWEQAAAETLKFLESV